MIHSVLLISLFLGSAINQFCPPRDLDCFSDNWAHLECSLRFANSSSSPGPTDNAYHSNPPELFINQFKISYDPEKRVYQTQDDEDFFHCESELSYTIREKDCSTVHGIINGFHIVRPGGLVVEEVSPAPSSLKLVLGRSGGLNCFKTVCFRFTVVKEYRQSVEQYTMYKNLTGFLDSLEILNLLPYTTYNLGIRSTPCEAEGEKFLSPWSNLTATTSPAEPIAPEVNPLGYQIKNIQNDTSMITLYWKSVGEKFRNGPNFSYVVEYSGKMVSTQQGKFTVLVPRGSITSFQISARNTAGYSPRVSLLVRAHLSAEVEVDSSVPSALLTANNTTLLVWGVISRDTQGAKLTRTGPEGLTVFWCTTIHCQSGVNWSLVDGSQSSIILPHDTKTVFISTGDTVNSFGLQQVSCLIHQETVKSKTAELSLSVEALQNINIHVQTPFCGQDLGELLMINTTLSYCKYKDGSCSGAVVEVQGTNQFNISGLVFSTCYIFWTSSILRLGSRMKGSIKKFCTAPENSPSIVSAYFMNNKISLELNILEIDEKETFCRFRISKFIFNSSCTEDVQLSIEKAAVSSFLDPACESVSVSACTKWECAPWSKAAAITVTPSIPTLTSTQINENHKIDLHYESSQADLCESKIYDNKVKEHARLSLAPPNCNGGNITCCSAKQIQSVSELVLGTETVLDCLHFNVSIRCGNWVRQHGKIRYFYSDWSNMMQVKVPCSQDYGIGELVGIGLGISIATVLGSALIFAAGLQIYRFKEKISALSHVEPSQGIPLSVNEQIQEMVNPFSDPPPEYSQETQASFFSESSVTSLPPYNTFQPNYNNRGAYEYQRIQPQQLASVR